MIRGLSSEDFRKICVELIYRMGFNVKSTAHRDNVIAINATYRIPGENLNYIILFIDKDVISKKDLEEIIDLSILKIKYLVISTGSYDEDAIRFARKHDIALVDGDGFKRMLIDHDLWEKVEKSKEHLREERKLPSTDLFDQYLEWAKNFFSEGNYRKAVEYAEKALALKESYEASVLKAKSLIGLGNYSEAESVLMQLIRNRESAELWHIMGEIYEKKGEINEALKAYSKSTGLDLSYYSSWIAMGNILQKKGKLEEALLCYEKALKINRNMPEIWNTRGLILKELNRLDEAVKCFDIAHELKKDYLEPLYNKVNIYLENGRYEECLKILEEILSKNPSDSQAYYLLARSYELMGDLNKAKEFAEKALELQPRDEKLKKYLNDLTKRFKSEPIRVNRFEEAFAYYILDIDFISENDDMATLVYASKLFNEKKYEDSLRIFQDLLVRGIDTKFNIASCKSALQRNIEAVSMFLELEDYARAYLSSRKIGKENDIKRFLDSEIISHLI